jgi:hypothetical protein
VKRSHRRPMWRYWRGCARRREEADVTVNVSVGGVAGVGESRRS